MKNARPDATNRRHASFGRLCVVAIFLVAFGLGAVVRAQEPGQEPAQERPQLLEHDPTAAWRDDAKRRSNGSIAIHLAREATAAAVLAWLAFSGAAARLRARIGRRVGRRLLLNAFFIAAIFSLLRGVSLPFDAGRFALARSYGVAHASVASWLGDFAIQFDLLHAPLHDTALLLLDRGHGLAPLARLVVDRKHGQWVL